MNYQNFNRISINTNIMFIFWYLYYCYFYSCFFFIFLLFLLLLFLFLLFLFLLLLFLLFLFLLFLFLLFLFLLFFYYCHSYFCSYFYFYVRAEGAATITFSTRCRCQNWGGAGKKQIFPKPVATKCYLGGGPHGNIHFSWALLDRGGSTMSVHPPQLLSSYTRGGIAVADLAWGWIRYE